jgi:hypothetical protein
MNEELDDPSTQAAAPPDADDGATGDKGSAITTLDPRALLAEWANKNDEWVRFVVGEVIQSGKALSNGEIAHAYMLFRQEKGLDERALDKDRGAQH